MDPLAEQPAQVLPELLGIHCLLSEILTWTSTA
jgi:hypothetical protein